MNVGPVLDSLLKGTALITTKKFFNTSLQQRRGRETLSSTFTTPLATTGKKFMETHVNECFGPPRSDLVSIQTGHMWFT